MGQSQGKERGEGSSAGNGAGSSSNSHIKSFDGGALVPQGVYTGPQDYDHGIVRNLIFQRKLAPFYKGLDDEDAYAQAPYNTECPICFLHYPSPLNHTRCCRQPICTECFVQIKRADPNHTNPPSSEPAACPYCQEAEFGVVYHAPPPGVLSGEEQHAAGTAESARAAREQAEDSAEGSHHQANRRKSFRADDPSVITTDMIRPDWQAKLQAAEAQLARRANRRIIMRQVGERLIPVGVSSSRMGSDLPPGSTTGPGGAIIIGENTRWPGSMPPGGVGERRGGRRRSDLANFLQNLGGGPDLEEVMMMEAMRLSLIEHEEQQRRQAQEDADQQRGATEGLPNTEGASATTTSNPAASATAAAPMAVPGSSAGPSSSSRGSPVASRTLPRSSSLTGDALPPAAMRGVEPSQPAAVAATQATATPVPTASQLGLSSSMMAELSELIDGGPSMPSRSTMPDATSSASRADRSSTLLPGHDASPSDTSTFNTADTSLGVSGAAMSGAITPPQQRGTASPLGTSPGRLGTNPNNPFRARMAASASEGAMGSTSPRRDGSSAT